jgi:hypothetical protein
MAKSQMSREQLVAVETIKRVYQALIDTVNETPQGAPAGPMYAALMQYMTLDQFTAMMDSLVYAKRIRREGDLYFPATKP